MAHPRQRPETPSAKPHNDPPAAVRLGYHSRPMSATRQASRGALWLLQAPAAAWLLTVSVVVLGALAIEGDRYLHDEGLLTWYFAQMTATEPAALLFFQKSRPLLSLLYAPLELLGLGLTSFLVVHTLVAAAALPLLAATARKLGLGKTANLAPALLATSALWFACGPAGVSNSDAVTGLSLVVYLWIVRDRPLAAGALLGALLFARSELALFAVGLGLFSLFHPRTSVRLALGLPLIPALYALCGALYHHDLLWALHFPPALPAPPPETPRFGAGGYGAELGTTLIAILSLTPGLLLLPALPLRPRGPWRMSAKAATLVGDASAVADDPRLRLFAALALAYLAAIRGLPILGLFNFDDSPRYLLPALPCAALALALIARRWSDADVGRRATLTLAIWLALAVVGEAEAGPLPLVTAALLFGILALARGGRPLLAGVALLLTSAATAPLLEPTTRMRRADNDPDLPALSAWLIDHPEHQTTALVTNIPVLDAWLRRQGVETGPVYYLLGTDQDYELEELSNAAVDQREALHRGIERTFYGRPLLPPRAPTDGPKRPRLFILNDDDRLDGSLPPDLWRGRLEPVATLGRLRIAVDQTAPPAP